MRVVPEAKGPEGAVKRRLLRAGARWLEERTVVHEYAEVAHAMSRELAPAPLQRACYKPESLTIWVWMALRTPKMRQDQQRQGSLAPVMKPSASPDRSQL